LKLTAWCTPAEVTAASAAAACPYVTASGFSQRTALPAAAAAAAISACVPGGVQMSTMSMSSRPTRARQSVVCSGTP
jgi:hypothetical protein